MLQSRKNQVQAIIQGMKRQDKNRMRKFQKQQFVNLILFELYATNINIIHFLNEIPSNHLFWYTTNKQYTGKNTILTFFPVHNPYWYKTIALKIYLGKIFLDLEGKYFIISIIKRQQMLQQTISRDNRLNAINMHVIKMINIKKYPKNYKNLHKAQKIRHLKTQTDEFKPYQTVKCRNSFFQQSKNQIKSIGHYFLQNQTRQILNQGIANLDFQLLTEKLNGYVLHEKKNLQETLHLQAENKDKQRKPGSLKNTMQKTGLKRTKQAANIEQTITKLRFKMKEEYNRYSQTFENPINRLVEIEKTHKRNATEAFNFFQNNMGIEHVMMRYPIIEAHRQPYRPDLQKQLRKDMLEDVKNNNYLSCDKYNRMRITRNHKKIVHLK